MADVFWFAEHFAPTYVVLRKTILHDPFNTHIFGIRAKALDCKGVFTIFTNGREQRGMVSRSGSPSTELGFST